MHRQNLRESFYYLTQERRLRSVRKFHAKTQRRKEKHSQDLCAFATLRGAQQLKLV